MANEFQSNMCTSVSLWNNTGDFNNEAISWNTQPFLPVELNQMQPCFGDSSVNQFDTMNDGAFFLPQISKVSPPPKQQVNLFNSAPYWSPPSNSLEDESNCSNQITMKRSAEAKKVGSEPASKKPRITAPSPLPTFKVRKEKLGDRITALQQLVSPFGKTDTASVLEEAIDYIRFLHGQVGALSTPYVKINGHQIQHQMGSENLKDEGQNLRSRGLCLVSLLSTIEVASETPMDFWIPNILGSDI